MISYEKWPGVLDLFSQSKLSQCNFLVALKVQSTHYAKKRPILIFKNFWVGKSKKESTVNLVVF